MGLQTPRSRFILDRSSLAKSQEDIFKRFLALGDEGELVERMNKQVLMFELFDNMKAVPSLDYSGKIIKDRKFPSVRNVDAMFKRLGIPRVFQRLSKRTRTDVELAFQSFMDVRNALAHESPPSITNLDVDRFGQVGAWIDAIDREFYSHVVRCSGSRYWS